MAHGNACLLPEKKGPHGEGLLVAEFFGCQLTPAAGVQARPQTDRIQLFFVKAKFLNSASVRFLKVSWLRVSLFAFLSMVKLLSMPDDTRLFTGRPW
jgi:hypothetical protein